MDKWIGNFVDKYNEMISENISSDVIRSFHYIAIGNLPKVFRRFVTHHLFYYEMITSKTLEDSHFDFILVYRSTPFKFNVDFYYGTVKIYVFLFDQCEIYSKLMIGKYLISDFLYDFISGQELYEYQSDDLDSDDNFEIPF